MFFCRKNSKLIAHNVLLSKKSLCHENSLQNHISVEIQLENRKCPVGKILFPNRKIIFSQLEIYFFPVGLFFEPNQVCF